ncbi:MAG TPA: sulfatase-like hydrolase/transferase [Vicinamibacterales bacterium]|nr:sulfatase-like hydrolase/transferase [Vicinamibacterales bacterium]
MVAISAAILTWRSGGNRFSLPSTADQNVLLITIDTLRADALSSYGGPAQSPSLDRLAAEGARFTFAHAHAVVTLPSHTSILSGLLPYEHGMRDNSGFRVRAGTPTLATRLKARGFATGAFVGGFPLTKRFGLTPGFDIYDDQMPETRGAVEISMPERPAADVVSRATAWIAQQQTPFFGWVHVFDPHSPYRPPQDLAGAYSTQPYYGEVAAVDRALGPLLDRLRTLTRPTLVIVTADHGESLGDHGELTHGMFAYEPTLRVPLIVSRIDPRSGAAAAGVVVGTPVRHIDIVPTVLDALGIDPDPSLAGASLREAIAGTAGDRPSYFESMTYNLVRGWAPLRGVLRERTKYIDLPIPELYDLGADPRESSNGAATQRERVQVLSNLLRTFNVAPPDRPGRETPEAAAALRSLGYVQGSAPAKAAYGEADDPKRLVEIDRDLHRATELNQAGRQQEAVAMLESVIARRPDTADAYMSLAYAFWQAGDPRQAIAVLEKGLSSGAPDRDIRIRLGIYLAESHIDSGKAIRLLEGMSAEDVEALNGLGVAYGDAGRSADALRTFRQILALDPTNGIAYQNLASIVLREALATRVEPARGARLQEAEAHARKAIEVDPALADAYTTLGVVLSTTGRKPDAIAAWQRAVALDASQFNALYNLWFELAAAGRRDDAVRYGRQFVDTAPPAFFAPDIARVRAYTRGSLIPDR